MLRNVYVGHQRVFATQTLATPVRMDSENIWSARLGLHGPDIAVAPRAAACVLLCTRQKRSRRRVRRRPQGEVDDLLVYFQIIQG